MSLLTSTVPLSANSKEITSAVELEGLSYYDVLRVINA